MMVNDANNINDENNNNGTSTCRLTISHRCFESSHDNNSKLARDKNNEDFQPTDNKFASKEKGHSALKPIQLTNGNCGALDASPKEVHAKCKHSQITEDNSLDELEDSSSSSEKENKTLGASGTDYQKSSKSAPIRVFRKQTSLRGILKYPPGWRRRAYSESSAQIGGSSAGSSDENCFYGTSLDSPDILWEFEDDLCDNEDALDKPKKNVTFPDKMVSATFVFRPGSSILGRRNKNQKKAKRRKDKKLRESLENLSDVEDKDGVEAAKRFIANQLMPYDSCDSTTDFSSSSGCDCSSTDCSGDEMPLEEQLNHYEIESKVGAECGSGSDKANRKNRRKRNRKNKQTVRTALETGGYDSD